MGSGRTRRHKAKAKARNKGRRSKPPAVPTSVHDLPDELLDRVLLGLGSPLHLVRAAATCRRWRRSISDPGFISRSRSLHGAPPLAGHYYVTDTLLPNATDQWCWTPEKPAVFVPSSLPAADVDGAHFSLDFLYEAPVEGDRPRYMYQCANRIRHNRCRKIIDSRGSLLLLRHWPWWNSTMDGLHCKSDFTVCEPPTRRCQGIAWPASLSHFQFLSAFLLDGCGGGDAGMSNFRVLLVLYEREWPQGGVPRACVFTPGCDGGWRLGWHPMEDDAVEVPLIHQIHFAGRAARRIYWGIETGEEVLVLDEGTLKFSLLTFPDSMRWAYRKTSFRVIGGVDGGAATVRVVRMDGEDLQVFGQLPWSGEWVVEKSVRLKDAATGLPGWKNTFLMRSARIVTAGDTFVVLTRTEKRWLFSVELDTMELERVHERNRHVGPAYPCTLPWPPILHACVDHGVAGKRRQRAAAACTM